MDMPYVDMPANLQTAVFLLGKGANNFVPELLKRYFEGKQPWIIADGNTFNAAGEKVLGLLKDAGFKPFEPYIFPPTPDRIRIWRFQKNLLNSCRKIVCLSLSVPVLLLALLLVLL